MITEDFEFLFARVAPRSAKQDTHLRPAISAKERFVVTLKFLASGENYEDFE